MVVLNGQGDGMDILPLSEAFGCELGTPKIDLQYSVKGIPTQRGWITLPSPQTSSKGEVFSFQGKLKLLKKKVGEELAMFGESEGAFTCAANLVGTEPVYEMVYEKTRYGF